MSSRNDEIHGRIQLSDLEDDLTSLPVFARLDRIRQLGLASYIFPGATHTRYSHSLGVMHVAGRMAERLGLDETEQRAIRLAGLLHDLGQYPLSHCIETVYRMLGDTSSAFEGGGPADPRTLLVQAASLLPSYSMARDKPVGAELIRRRDDIASVFQRHLGADADQIRRQVAELVSGEAAASNTGLLHQQILNSDYDCDRLDYVRRDARSAGLSYGDVEVDYLIEHLATRFFPPTSSRKLMAVDSKGLTALEHYLIARYFMYSTLYFHPSVRGYELLAKAAMLGFARAGKTFGNAAELYAKLDTPEFENWDDSKFYALASTAASDESWAGAEVANICRDILGRREPRLVYSFQAVQESPTEGDFGTALFKCTDDYTPLPVWCEQEGVAWDTVVVDSPKPLELVPLQGQVSWDFVLQHETVGIQRGTQEIEDALKAPRVLHGEDDLRLLTDHPGTLLSVLGGKSLHMLRIYSTASDMNAIQKLRERLARELPR